MPKEMDSVTQQLNLLALFFEAKKQAHIAGRLHRLAERLNAQTSAAQITTRLKESVSDGGKN